MKQNLGDILSVAASSIGITLRDKDLSLFETYYAELLAWNKKINLVSAKSPLDIPIKHFIDSLTPLPFIMNTSGRLLDIGTGAGFPGVPLKIAMPSLKVHLLESSRKKTSFLKHIIRTLGLDDVSIIHNRLEHIMADDMYKNHFDIVVSRATFKISALLEFSSFFLNNNGIAIAMKGKQVTDELKDAINLCDTRELEYLSCHDIRLPVIHDTRKIVLFKKILKTM